MSTDVFGKGTRVRIVEGDDEGVEGEIFWWGRSKWGHGMRAGVTNDDGGDKVWADAPMLRAIDDEGNELDPQPAMGGPIQARPDLEIRGIDVPFGLARALTAVRVHRRLPRRKASTATVRLERLRRVEQRVDATVPDAVIAWVIAGIGAIREIRGILALTDDLRAHFDGELPPAIADAIVFDVDKNGDYLVFVRGTATDDPSCRLLLNKGGYAESVEADLEARLLAELGNPKEIDRALQPFEVVVDFLSEPDPEPEIPAEVWIAHKKFGRGRVVSREVNHKGEKLTIEFADGETRKLMSNFVEFE